jgi:uncharacterized membrane protein
VVHRLLVQIYPPYRERIRAFDRKMTWITIILVVYLVVNFVIIIYSFFFR